MLPLSKHEVSRTPKEYHLLCVEENGAPISKSKMWFSDEIQLLQPNFTIILWTKENWIRINDHLHFNHRISYNKPLSGRNQVLPWWEISPHYNVTSGIMRKRCWSANIDFQLVLQFSKSFPITEFYNTIINFKKYS